MDTFEERAYLKDADCGHEIVVRRGGARIGRTTLLIQSSEDFYLGDICVHPPYRGQGVGTLLLERAIALARREGCVRLWCDPKAYVSKDPVVYDSAANQARLDRWYTDDAARFVDGREGIDDEPSRGLLVLKL